MKGWKNALASIPLKLKMASLAFISFFIMPFVIFGPSTLGREVFVKISSPQWWGDNIPAFLFFTFLFSIVSWVINIQAEKARRLPYENWKVKVIWEKNVKEQDLFWEEVERFEKSDFERWKFVKSIISAVGHTSLTTVHEAEKRGWIRFRKDGRLIEVNLDKACEVGHVESGETNRSPDSAPIPEHPDIR